MKVHTYKNSENMHRAVSQAIIDAVIRCPNLVLGLSTGNSPLGTYANLIKDHQENGTDYSKVVTFNLDEYAGLEEDDPNSYRYFMNQHLFDHLNIPLANTHVPVGTGDLEAVCAEYESKIRKAGGIDLQLLGIGVNGHIGFNEPGTPFDSKTHVAQLSEETIVANARFFPTENHVPSQAVTMGIDSIYQARKIILMAMGASKAPAISEMLNGPVSTALPASILQRHKDVVLYLDEGAASLI